MKIAIIGAGNMGGAIARGIALANIDEMQLAVSCPNRHGELDKLRAECSNIIATTDNAVAAQGADIVVIAVKPWLLDDVMRQLQGSLDLSRQAIASVVAGVELARLESYAPQGCHPSLYRIIPNIAAAHQQSMTFIAAKNATPEEIETVAGIFATIGRVMVVEERLMAAGTALASCGIAYAMRYVRAAMEGGVELGFTPQQSLDIVLQTLAGTTSMLTTSGDHPETAIDKVTTAGGLTIKGLNAMERNGFTTAVIEGLKASMSK